MIDFDMIFPIQSIIGILKFSEFWKYFEKNCNKKLKLFLFHLGIDFRLCILMLQLCILILQLCLLILQLYFLILQLCFFNFVIMHNNIASI